MYSYYTITYAGRTVHVVKAKTDTNENVQVSLMSDKYDSADPVKLASQFSDSALDADGWTKIAVINGGIFNDEYAPLIYANGLEKSYWTDHEMTDDHDLNGVMAVGHTGGYDSLDIETQATIRANGGSYRGCVTAAFGLVKNGVITYGDILQGSFSSVSGRSIIGKTAAGEIVIAAMAGVTRSTGITGAQAADLALNYLGLYNAVCLDGGGSVSFIYNGSWKVSTNREIKNAFGIYVKANSGGGGGGGTINGFQHRDSYTPIYDKKIPHKVYIAGSLVDILDVQVMTNSELVSIDDIVVYNN